MIEAGATVIPESTSYPGTTRHVLGPLLAEVSGLASNAFHLGYSPERIDPGNPTWHLKNTPKIVSGIDEPSLHQVRSLYADLVERVVPVADCETAELAKLVENTFRHVNIGLVNELAMLSHDLGLDIWQAIDAAATKPFGYLRFTPGPGVGGHCLPIDPVYLSWKVEQTLSRSFRFADLAADINARMPDYVARRVVEGLYRRGRPMHGARVLLLGYTYKPNTADTRETPAAPIARRLRELGAHLRIADPHLPADASLPDGSRVDADPAQLATADVVVLLVDHDVFDYQAIAAHARYVLDCRRRLAGTAASPAAHIETL